MDNNLPDHFDSQQEEHDVSGFSAIDLIKKVQRNFGIAALAMVMGAMATHEASAQCTPERETFVAMNAETGEILIDHDGNEKIQPASMTKMMTLLLAYEAMEDGLIDEDDRIYIATGTYLRGDMERFSGWRSPVKFGDALAGAAVRSYNDLAATIAENVAKVRGVGNTETDFISLMNERAREIGMDSTVFYNSSGLPASLIRANGKGSTTHDMAVLLKHIADEHPDLLQLMGTSEAHVRRLNLRNTNTLLHKDDLPYDEVYGKTGFTCKTGFALTAFVRKGDESIIASYVGGKNVKDRELDFMALLDEAFEKLEEEQQEIPEIIPASMHPPPLWDPYLDNWPHNIKGQDPDHTWHYRPFDHDHIPD